MYDLNDRRREVLDAAVSKAVKDICQELGGEEADKGGYFRLYLLPADATSYADIVPLHGRWVGGASNFERGHKYQTISFEKAIRLATNHLKHGHTTSWKSRDPEELQYGGAILIEMLLEELGGSVRLIFSFSGLPEKGDEATMLSTALNTGWSVRPMDITPIQRQMENPLAESVIGDYFLKTAKATRT